MKARALQGMEKTRSEKTGAVPIFCPHRYALQRLALAPFLNEAEPEDIFSTLNSLSQGEKERLASIIENNALGPLWLEIISKEIIGKVWSREWTEKLQKQNRSIGIHYIGQLQAMRKITGVLDDNSITHVFFKGAHTREAVYKNPATRYACDLDLLVADEDKATVIEILSREGFEYFAKPENLSHEASLVKNHIHLDLHWHILRPGRIPKSLTQELLDTRVRQNGYWSLSNECHLFVLLVHPIFTKYQSITLANLLLLLDLVFWLRQPFDWNAVHSLLAKTGLRSAAWIMLEYLKILTGTTVSPNFLESIAPPPCKQWYLYQWIHRDLPVRFKKTPFIPKFFFTLLAHDTIKDVSFFLKTYSEDRRLNKF